MRLKENINFGNNYYVIYSQRLTQVITVMLMMENRDVPLTLQLGAFVSGPPLNGSKERVVMK